MVSATHAVLALLTGFLTGAIFRFLNVPIPAPSNVAGVLGIAGIFLGYAVLDHYDVGIDLLGHV